MTAEAQRLTALGATISQTLDEPDGFHLIMQDPEGNEFCVA
ncbi:VOC family protein [Kribbella ginsengisoli]